MPNPPEARGRLLIVDHDPQTAKALCGTARELGYAVDCEPAPAAALDRLKESPVDLLLVELTLPEMDGPQLIQKAQGIDPLLLGILLAEKERIPGALAALQRGAFDYLQKPVPAAVMQGVLDRALKVRRLQREVAELRVTAESAALSLALGGSLDEGRITEQVLEAAARQTNADEVTLLRVQDQRSGLQIIGARGEGRAAIVGEEVPITAGPVGFVAQSQEPLILHGPVSDPRIAPLHPRPDLRSTLVIPMVAGGDLVGVLTANAVRRQPFGDAELKALEILAAIAAPALRAAQLIAALRREVARLRTKLAGVPARPPAGPEVPGAPADGRPAPPRPS
jgi:DNA-binding response OmpR family regulator